VDLKGAAVRLSSPTGTNYGMPGNTLRDLFVQNVDRPNEEHQIYLNAQSTCTVENLDLEGSRYHQVLHLWGGGTIRNLHLEHLEVTMPKYRLIFVGGGPITIDGLDVDGEFNARDTVNNIDTYGSIIESYGPSLVLSGAQGFRGEDQESGGITPTS